MSYTQSEIDTARAAILAAITTGAGVVEYSIDGRTVKTDPELALRSLEKLEAALSKTGRSPFSRRSKLGFGRA